MAGGNKSGVDPGCGAIRGPTSTSELQFDANVSPSGRHLADDRRVQSTRYALVQGMLRQPFWLCLQRARIPFNRQQPSFARLCLSQST